jgi:hypothetical protein
MADRKQRKMHRTRSPHHRVIYANQTMVTVTNVDIRLRFGVVEKATQEDIYVEDQVDVLLGPVEAASVAGLIVKQLEKIGFKIAEPELGETVVEDGRKTEKAE